MQTEILENPPLLVETIRYLLAVQRGSRMGRAMIRSLQVRRYVLRNHLVKKQGRGWALSPEGRTFLSDFPKERLTYA